jgi:hypothetical protein
MFRAQRWIVAAVIAAGAGRDLAAQAPNSAHAFAIEALGGAAGSLAGIAVVGLTSHCGAEDLECTILHVGAGGALGVIGAAAGVTLAARHTGSRHSVAGALLGGVAGTALGLGVHYLLNRGTDRNLGDRVVVPIFVLSQGIVAAAGARWLGRARGDSRNGNTYLLK